MDTFLNHLITEKEVLADQLASLGREIPQVEAELALRREFGDRLRDFAERRDMLDRGMSVSGEYESRLQAYHSERSEVARLDRELVQLAGQRDELTRRLAGFDLQAEARIAEIRRELLDIDQRISEGEAKREVQVTAPRDGTVTAILTRAGQTVGTGTPLLTIVPTDQPLLAQLVAPSGAIGVVREGTQVLLRYQAFPCQKFGQYPAEVSVISRANLQPDEVAELTAGADAPADAPTLYRVTATPAAPWVAAYGRREPLQAGMQVEAHLFVDRRPIYQWILEPIIGLRGRLGPGEAQAETADVR